MKLKHTPKIPFTKYVDWWHDCQVTHVNFTDKIPAQVEKQRYQWTSFVKLKVSSRYHPTACSVISAIHEWLTLCVCVCVTQKALQLLQIFSFFFFTANLDRKLLAQFSTFLKLDKCGLIQTNWRNVTWKIFIPFWCFLHENITRHVL